MAIKNKNTWNRYGVSGNFENFRYGMGILKIYIVSLGMLQKFVISADNKNSMLPKKSKIKIHRNIVKSVAQNHFVIVAVNVVLVRPQKQEPKESRGQSAGRRQRSRPPPESGGDPVRRGSAGHSSQNKSKIKPQRSVEGGSKDPRNHPRV